MGQLFRLASKITDLWSLAAFGIAAIVQIAYIASKLRGRRSVPSIAWVSVVLLVAIPTSAFVYLKAAEVRSQREAIHRIRVTVVGPDQIPIENAKVWTSVGGEPKKVSGGWQFDIPVATKPTDGKLTVFAAVQAAFLSGKKELVLGSDYNPTIIITLEKDISASVRGIVIDASGRAIGGAYVNMPGYTESVKTENGGQFVLPAHAADGQQVYLHVQKKGYKPINQYHPAGNQPVTIVLERE